MSREPQAKRYLRWVRSSLHVPRQQRRRALEEIENHLDEAVAAHTQRGATPAEAAALATHDLGPAEGVAAAFNDAARTPDDRRATQWLPLVVPVLLLVLTATQLAWSLTWLRGGLTKGERVAQRDYLENAAVAAALAYMSYRSVRRARDDRTWRWVAWLWTVLAIAVRIHASS